MRKSAFQEAGGFSAVLPFGGEEQLLALELATAGWDLCYFPQLVAFHQPSRVRSSAPARRARLLRNEFRTSCMRRPAGSCIAASRELLRGAVGDSALARDLAEALIRLPAAFAPPSQDLA